MASGMLKLTENSVTSVNTSSKSKMLALFVYSITFITSTYAATNYRGIAQHRQHKRSINSNILAGSSPQVYDWADGTFIHLPESRHISLSPRTLVKRNAADHFKKSGLKVSSLIGSPKKRVTHDSGKKHNTQLRLKLASAEVPTSAERENGISMEDSAGDFDIVLDLDEQKDFDRLLNMLSRSGPAKHDDENGKKSKKTSTYIDRHDEARRPQTGASLLDAYKEKHPYKAHLIDEHDDGSHFDDLEKEMEDAEQRRLERLYFKSVEGSDGGKNTGRAMKHRHGNSGTTLTASHCSSVIAVIVTTLLLTSFR